MAVIVYKQINDQFSKGKLGDFELIIENNCFFCQC